MASEVENAEALEQPQATQLDSLAGEGFHTVSCCAGGFSSFGFSPLFTSIVAQTSRNAFASESEGVQPSSEEAPPPSQSPINVLIISSTVGLAIGFQISCFENELARVATARTLCEVDFLRRWQGAL
eukprot:160307-Chlamydomonas_euryale.AAC.1